MAVGFRPIHSFSWSLVLVLATRFVRGVSVVTSALAPAPQLTRVNDPNVVLDNSNGTTIVYSPVTGQQIPQGMASDGSGSGFSTSAVLWIVFSFAVGAPLLLVGFRGSRLTLGTAIGTAAALASWAVIVNTLSDVGVSDVALTVCILILFIMGFCLGFLELTRVVAILVLGILGGVAIGVRVILLRSGLLISDPDVFFVNWLIIGVCGVGAGVLVVVNQKCGILVGCASTGSFLCGLGFDLAINQQSGMSRGLRYLFDRNSFHFLDNIANGYSPPRTTVIILAVSLGVTPAFAFAQWKAFTHAFDAARHDTSRGSVWESQEALQDEESAPIPQRSVELPEKMPGVSLRHDTTESRPT